MSDVDFNSILDTPAEEIKSKPPLPIGTYEWRIKGLENIVSSQKKTPGVEFDCECVSAGEDVDQQLLEEAGGFHGRSMKLTFYVTADSASMIRDFLTEHCGLNSSGKTLRQLLAECTNLTFRGVVNHAIAQKSGRPYAQISQTMAIE